MAIIRYLSDTHFFHQNIITLDGRPFQSLEEMHATLIENWNRVVAKGDLTYILGDFCWQRKESVWLELLHQLNGNKVLIRGNHDLDHPSQKLRAEFVDFKDYQVIRDNGRSVVLCHYPIMFYKNASSPATFMLCGHVHTTRENDFLERWREELRRTRSEAGDSYGNIYNVGCMMPYMDYTPRTLDEILAAHSQ